ncbi:MAG: hypothetical protein NWE90_02075 [Candidatus Bathyarchaeota archaeon]|nr:hypothetical protein [Candidatus Bathyarchaeota archaeon]
MMQSQKILLPIILAGLLITGFTIPVEAQPPTPKWSLEPYTVNINPCQNFTLTLWIRDIPDGWAMTDFEFIIEWDPTMMEIVGFPIFLGEGRGWGATFAADTIFLIMRSSGPQWSEDAAWFEFTFHCIGEGTSTVTLRSPEVGTITLVAVVGGGTVNLEPEPFEVTVNQVELAPVGGIASPTNKIELLAPYIILTGLIVAVSAVIIKKRK